MICLTLFFSQGFFTRETDFAVAVDAQALDEALIALGDDILDPLDDMPAPLEP